MVALNWGWITPSPPKVVIRSLSINDVLQGWRLDSITHCRLKILIPKEKFINTQEIKDIEGISLKWNRNKQNFICPRGILKEIQYILPKLFCCDFRHFKNYFWFIFWGRSCHLFYFRSLGGDHLACLPHMCELPVPHLSLLQVRGFWEAFVCLQAGNWLADFFLRIPKQCQSFPNWERRCIQGLGTTTPIGKK